MNRIVPAIQDQISSLSQELQQNSFCRICLQSQTPQQLLITPCRCDGSVKYVHIECMKTWILSQFQNLQQATCQLCKTPLLMSIKLHSICSIQHSCNQGISHCIFAPLLLLVLSLLSIIIFLLIQSLLQNQDQNSTIYSTLLLLISFLAFIFILILVCKSIKDLCIIRTIKKWTIFSQKFQDSHFVSDIQADNSVMVLPATVRVNGLIVRTPEVSPPNLSPINRNGAVVGYISTPLNQETYQNTEENRNRFSFIDKPFIL